MSLKAKNRIVYSYKNKQVNKSNFIYKDFNKTSSHCSNFNECSFKGTSFRATSFKYCSFINCKFVECDFVSVKLTGTKFINCTFSDNFLINFNNVKTTFNNCLFNSNVIFPRISCISLDIKDLNVIYEDMPKIDCFDCDLLMEIAKLKSNEYIKRSRTIFRGTKLNTLVLNEMLNRFGREKVVGSIDTINQSINKDFYTTSYLFRFFK